MDNITHTLIGATMGEGIRRIPVFRDRSKAFLSVVLWAAIIGNNFPDSDFLLNWYWKGGKLGYLLHHRGLTHTLFAIPFEALLTLLIAALIVAASNRAASKSGLRELPARDWLALFGIATVSLLAHIGADFMNDYGVHPLAPFWPHWTYGGVLFIVEPLLWAALLPLLVFRFSSKPVKALGIVLIGLFMGLVWVTPILAWPVALACTLFLGISLLWQRKRPGTFQPVFCALAVLMVFSMMGYQTRKVIRARILREQPEERITQLVTTPAPGNPFCWRVISVSRMDMDGLGGHASGQVMTPFFERLGGVSLWPRFFSPENCFWRMTAERTAPLMKASVSSDETVHWIGEFRGTTESLAVSAAQYCRFRQFLLFARVPFFFKMPGNILIGGDLRYDNESELGFAEMEFSQDQPCLSHAPRLESPAGLLPSGPQEKP